MYSVIMAAVLNWWAANICLVGCDRGWEFRNLFDV